MYILIIKKGNVHTSYMNVSINGILHLNEKKNTEKRIQTYLEILSHRTKRKYYKTKSLRLFLFWEKYQNTIILSFKTTAAVEGHIVFLHILTHFLKLVFTVHCIIF